MGIKGKKHLEFYLPWFVERNLPLSRGTGRGRCLLNMSSIPSLESIYGSLTADITANTAKLERLGNQTDIVEDEFGEEDNVEKKISKVLTDIEKAKEEAEDVLEQMELEIRGLDAGSAERDRRLNQWQSHRVELRRLIAQVEKSKKAISAKRRSLGLDDDSPDVATLNGGGGGQERLLDNNESLERGGRKLNIGQRLLAETEGVGAAVLEDLSRQRETLQNARAKLRDTTADLQTSSKVLSKMLHRILQNRVVLFLVA